MIEELKLEETDGTAFIAFARVFSGTLNPGQDVYVLQHLAAKATLEFADNAMPWSLD